MIRRSVLLLAAAIGLGGIVGCGSETSNSPPPPAAGTMPPPPSAADLKKGGVASNPAYDSARGGTAPK